MHSFIVQLEARARQEELLREAQQTDIADRTMRQALSARFTRMALGKYLRSLAFGNMRSNPDDVAANGRLLLAE